MSQFYLIVSGSATLIKATDSQRTIELEEGDMFGHEEFESHDRKRFHYRVIANKGLACTLIDEDILCLFQEAFLEPKRCVGRRPALLMAR